jgi:hypothetical protein
MIPGASSYHSYNLGPRQPFVNTYGRRTFVPPAQMAHYHARQYHATPPAHHTYNRPSTPPAPQIPNTTIKTVGDNRSVSTTTQLKPGTVVEVTRPGHQTEYAYANYGGHLSPLTQSTLNRVPNEIRDQVKRMGGPSYFAHDLHNKFSTTQFMSQFNANNYHGPNKPLI